MARTRIAINGFGRIGRIFFRQAFAVPSEALAKARQNEILALSDEAATKSEGFWRVNPERSERVNERRREGQALDIVAINDIGSPENLAYLLKYDTIYGLYEKPVAVAKEEQTLLVDGKKIQLLQEKDPAKLPWKDLNVDIVVEATGVFESYEKAKPHLEAGAKRVVLTAPAKDDITPTATPNVGEAMLGQDKITSNASCTTNAATPIMAVMMGNPGVKKAIANTVHGYTATQGLVDGPDHHGDFRRGRAAAMNIVPSSTGAALAATKAVPELAGKFDGIAVRVPIIAGSLLDFTFIASRPTSAEEINQIFREAARQKEWHGILTVTEEPLVSSDILKNPHGSIVDLAMTRVVDGDLVKILGWYDNEWGYCAMLLKHVLAVAALL